MATIIKRTLLIGLMLVLNACVLHPHPLFGGGHGGAHYDGGYYRDGPYHSGHGHGRDRHRRRHH